MRECGAFLKKLLAQAAAPTFLEKSRQKTFYPASRNSRGVCAIRFELIWRKFSTIPKGIIGTLNKILLRK